MKRKILAILLCAVMLLSLFACDITDTPNTEITGSSSSSSSQGGEGGGGIPSIFTDRYTRIDEEGNKDRNGDYILFGSYPQSEVTDGVLTGVLEIQAGTLPTSDNAHGWTSYGYYISGSKSNYMWYIDIEHNGETYRGVYFTSYRPYYTDYSSSSSNSDQGDNGYDTGNVYWFKWEPIKWRILTETNGKAFLHCEMLIDSQEYYDNYSIRTIEEETVYPNNYEHSNIRKWLNYTFYESAFNTFQRMIIQTTTVDNSVASTGYSSNSYACADTEDKIFLMSAEEMAREEYGFNTEQYDNDEAREKKTTDYAKSQGAWTFTSSSHSGNGYWWLRSPYNYYSDIARSVNSGGYVYDDGDGVDGTHGGVAPALWINL